MRSYLERMGAAVGRLGHELVVLAPGPRDEERPLGERARLLRYRAPAMPYDPTYHWPVRVSALRDAIRRERPDVLQASSPFVPALVAGLSRGVPLRTYVHHSNPIGCYLEPLAEGLPGPLPGWVVGPAWSWLRGVSRVTDLTVVAGDWLAAELTQHRCQHVRSVPFGINREELGPERRDPELRARLLGPLAGDPAARLVLIAGRLAADKRQGRVVEAIARLAATRPIGLVVVGDGPERARLEAAARGLGSATFVQFTKNRSDYGALLASVDLLAHGSLCETYGFVLGETLASGTPLVVPDRGGAFAFADPSCAEVYPALGGPAEVAAAVERLLDRDPVALRQAALQRAQREPSLTEHFEALVALYSEALGRT